MINAKISGYEHLVIFLINGWFVFNMMITTYMAITYIISHYIDGNLWTYLLFSLSAEMIIETIIRLQILDF